MAALLGSKRSDVLYVSGAVSNQNRFYDRFDAVVLLSAPHDVLFDRLQTRTTNDYGKRAAEHDEIAHNILTVEPMLRKSSTHEIDTTAPVRTVVAHLIRIGEDADAIAVAAGSDAGGSAERPDGNTEIS